MIKKYFSLTTDIDEINAHLEKLYEKIELQIQLHGAFNNQQIEIKFSGKNYDSPETSETKIEFSAS